jgi:pyrroline-5-carboxylate reductase
MKRYGFFGTGSMGSMLIRQFVGTCALDPGAISACSRGGASARALAAETGITASASCRDVAAGSDVLFVCVRPLDVRELLTGLRDCLDRPVLVVSIAGGVSLDDIAAWAGPKARCAKVIPSLTAEERGGISLVAWGRGITPEDREDLMRLLGAIGTPVEIEEHHFGIYTDLTSCGPALIAAMMEEFAAAAVRKEGVPREMTEYLVRETLAGTAKVIVNRQMQFPAVIDRVATKGGTTEEGVRILRARLPAVYDEMIGSMLAKLDYLQRRIAEQRGSD